MKPEPVNINGKDYPVKYGFSALRAFSDVTGTSLAEMDKLATHMTMTQAIALVWAGLKDGARVLKQDFTLTLDDVGDLLDDDNEALNKVLAVFSNSMAPPAKPTKGRKKK